MKRNLQLSVLFCLAAIPAVATPISCTLLQPVQAALDDKWRGWRLLQLADLRSDDQTLWREHPLNGKLCPGVNRGKFDGLHIGFVFTLRDLRDSCKVFVQAFYDWYVPLALNNKVWRAWDVAVRRKPQAFTPQLAQLIRQDTKAQRKASELVGLDFDPFLNSQDQANAS